MKDLEGRFLREIGLGEHLAQKFRLRISYQKFRDTCADYEFTHTQTPPSEEELLAESRAYLLEKGAAEDPKAPDSYYYNGHRLMVRATCDDSAVSLFSLDDFTALQDRFL